MRMCAAWCLGIWLPMWAVSTAEAQTTTVQHQPGSLDLRHRGTQVEGPPLTLEAALDEALQRNPDLIALRKAFDAARLRPAQERFLAPPTLEAQIWQWPITSVNPANTNMYMFMATQELPGRGKRALRAAVAEKNAAIAENDVAIRGRAIVDEVKRTYAELFLARKAIDIHLASVALLRQFADVSTAKYETGRISQQDVLKAVVEVSKLHEDLVMLDERAGVAEARLNTLLDRAPDAPVGPLAEPRTRVSLPTASELQRIALEHQPELETPKLEVEKGQAARALALREYKPDFSVTAGYMLMPGDAGAWLGNIAITWPTAPWSRGKLDAKKAEADAQIEAARARQRAAENRVRLAVQEAYVRVQTAQQRAELLSTTVLPQSGHTLEVSRVAYQTDRVDFLALIDNQRTLLDAQLAYYRALSDLEQGVADLERAVGADVAKAGTSIPAASVDLPRSDR